MPMQLNRRKSILNIHKTLRKKYFSKSYLSEGYDISFLIIPKPICIKKPYRIVAEAAIVTFIRYKN